MKSDTLDLNAMAITPELVAGLPRLTHAEWVYLQQNPGPAMPLAVKQQPVKRISPPKPDC